MRDNSKKVFNFMANGRRSSIALSKVELAAVNKMSVCFRRSVLNGLSKEYDRFLKQKEYKNFTAYFRDNLIQFLLVGYIPGENADLLKGAQDVAKN